MWVHLHIRCDLCDAEGVIGVSNQSLQQVRTVLLSFVFCTAEKHTSDKPYTVLCVCVMEDVETKVGIFADQYNSLSLVHIRLCPPPLFVCFPMFTM